MEGRLRKRSLRASESSAFPVEPLRKKLKKQDSPVEVREKVKKSKGNKKAAKHSPPTKKRKFDGNSPVETKAKRRLLVSLNIQENDLQVHKNEKLNLPGLKTKGKGTIQRSESVEGGSDFGSTVSSTGNGPSNKPTMNLKNPNFTFSSIGLNKKRIWKNLKQLLTAEKSCSPGSLVSSYSTIDAPPSFSPAKKYSDLSGFLAKYTDPLTRIYYSNAEEFQMVRTLPQDVVQGYLALRGKLMIT